MPSPTLASPPVSEATCLPFKQTTARQRHLAIGYVMDELATHFPTLDFVTWADAVLRLMPDLWVEGEVVSVEYPALLQLTQYLAGSPELPPLDPPIYSPQAAYLAKRLLTYQDEAIHALADLEANPSAYGPHVLALVTGLAAGNGMAHEVYRATHPGAEHAPNRPDPAPERAAVAGRVAAIQQARQRR
ncbi:hypothetical protein [Hymenobacter psoromatis]|uniref:hypothetical protein n=1 Tax=Hymenobacter psoromatis TaxID=1484116 RepID=UPI001CBB4B1B|nr:hypothetical protein [Hymenobacter psoromatis]